MDQDIRAKRASFIADSTECREMFSFASPYEVLRAVKVYVGSHYGSNLRELDTLMARMYYTAWRTCVKLAWRAQRYPHILC